jgi:glycosyltransferase involved in cell wall biosynthesis
MIDRAPQSADALPVVSIVIPCRNEASHIRRCLDSVLAGDYPFDLLDIVVVDGMSDDETRSIVAEFIRRTPAVRMIDNPGRMTPSALNLGIEAARGSIILRMDAHSAYPRHYVSRLVWWLSESGADNVGGSCVTIPANNSVVARAIAMGLSHRLGVGNSQFRLGTREARWVDTVPYGCYRRSVFERLGGFDEALPRNQDDEFNARLRSRGGRILLVPDVSSEYFARDSLGKLWRMYYQYGLFKPLAVLKSGSRATLRQLVPVLFLLGLCASALTAMYRPIGPVPFEALAGLYAAAIIAGAFTVAPSHGIPVAVASVAVFPVIHFSYGLGYLKGLILLSSRRSPSQTRRALRLTR